MNFGLNVDRQSPDLGKPNAERVARHCTVARPALLLRLEFAGGLLVPEHRNANHKGLIVPVHLNAAVRLSEPQPKGPNQRIRPILTLEQDALGHCPMTYTGKSTTKERTCRTMHAGAVSACTTRAASAPGLPNIIRTD